jgi:hypothetical protein
VRVFYLFYHSNTKNLLIFSRIHFFKARNLSANQIARNGKSTNQLTDFCAGKLVTNFDMAGFFQHPAQTWEYIVK